MSFDSITKREECFSDDELRKIRVFGYFLKKKTFKKKAIYQPVLAFSLLFLVSASGVMAFSPSYSPESVSSAIKKTLIVGGSGSFSDSDSISGAIFRIPEKFKNTVLGINKNNSFLQLQHNGTYANIYAEAEKKYGVSRHLLAAVHYVETGQSGNTDAASYAGAKGPMQFMDGTFERYKQDGDGDGVASVYDVHDAIYTAANYLAANGASSGNVRGALYRYNHSYAYVEKVMAYARGMGL